MDSVAENNPLISIIIPTFNRGIYLQQAIRSVINQDYQNWELIIVDNNSIDETDSIIHEFHENRIRLFKINNEGLIGKSRNLGIKQSQGEWIAFLDSDDYWFPNKLTLSLKECSNNVDLIFHDLQISFDEDISYFKKVKGWKLNSPVLRDLLIRGNAIANSSVMVRGTIIRKIGEISEDMEINPCVDYNTWLKISVITDSFVYIPKSLGIYRVHSGGISQRDMSFPHEKAISEFLDVLSVDELALIRKKIAFVHARYKFVNKQYKEIVSLLYSCMTVNDLMMTAKALFMLSMVYLFKILNR